MGSRTSRRLRTISVVLAACAAVVPAAPGGSAAHSTALLHREREPAGTSGRNDTPATAEAIRGFGTGRHERGTVRITGSLAGADVDAYSVRLEVGDVIGAAVAGAVTGLSLHGPDGRQVLASRGTLSFLYPAASPLPRGESLRPVFHHIVTRAGRYAVAVRAGSGRYEATVAAHRPGPEQARRGVTQTLFIDLDGARVDTTPFQRFGAVPGIRDLSPLAAFLPRWGLSPADEPALVRTIVTTVRDILHDAVARGANPHAAVRIRTSATDPDAFGTPNVTRVVVGGSVAEAVFTEPTIGVAESIDPGNFAREETGLVLLDLLSGPPDDPVSLNYYLTAASDRIRFIGQVLGQIAAHEAAHLYGSFHTDPGGVADLMDGGPGTVPAAAFGVGPDGIGGTADDVALRLGRDDYHPAEAFTGVQDTRNVTAFGLSRGRR